MGSFFLAVLVSVVAGLALSFWAKKQGREPYRWFLAGVFFSVLALAVAYRLNRRKQHDLAV